MCVWNIHYYRLKHMNEMLCLKGGRRQQTSKLTRFVKYWHFVLFVLGYTYIFLFFFFAKETEYYEELIRMPPLPPSFPLLQCHGEHDLQLYLTKPNFLQSKCPNVHPPALINICNFYTSLQPSSTITLSFLPTWWYKLYHIVLTSTSLIITEDQHPSTCSLII